MVKNVVRYHKTESDYREVTESYKYDSKGNMTQYTNPNGDVSKYTFDADYSMIIESEVPLGNGSSAKTEFTLDGNGNYATQKEYSSTTEYVETTFVIQEQGLLLQKNIENGQLDYKVNYGYTLSPKIGFKDEENFHAAIYTKKWSDIRSTLNANGTTKYVKYQNEIDPLTKQIKASIDPNGNRTTYDYDYKGRITEVINADNTTNEVIYSDANKYYIVKSPTGSKSKYTYDGFGKLLKEEAYFDDKYFTTLINQYNTDYQISSITDSKGNVTTYSYDLFGRMIESISDGETEKNEFDDYSNTKKRYDQENNWTLSKYDVYSNLIEQSKLISVNIVKSLYTYDNTGNVLTSTNPNGSKYTYEYDLLGQLVKVVDPNGSISVYQYDKSGSLKLSQQKDNNYNRTYQKQVISNQFGKPILYQDERGKLTKYWYDDNSNLIKNLDPNGETDFYKYNTRNLVEEIQYPTYKKSFDYNGIGLVKSSKIYDSLSATTPMKTYNYSYDEQNRIKRRTLDNDMYTEYSYDSNGNVTKLRDYFGGVTTYSYDSKNLLKSVSYGDKTFAYEYYSDGTIKSIAYPVEDYSATFTYDEGNHIKSLKNNKNSLIEDSFNYTYDNIGNLKEIRNNNSVKVQGGYDKLGQIKALNIPGNTINYYYDVRGNMVAQIGRNPIELAYSLGDYQWNSEDQLSKFTSNSGDITTYSYDDRGLRESKKNTTDNVIYYYDTSSRLVNEKVNGNDVTIINGHLPLMRVINNKFYYYVYNGHGDIIKLIDDNGNSVNEYSYNIWGEIINSTETVYNDQKYSAEIYDTETSNYYLKARYYNPETHRFISADTYEGELKNPLTMNQNIYCINNPLIYVDPSGNKHIVSDHVFTTYEKVYGYGARGTGYVLNGTSQTIKKHEFTNLNISVYESRKYVSVLADGAELNGYHHDAESAFNGELSCGSDSDGTYYLDIESLVQLDKEYGTKKLVLGGKTALSFTADVVATASGYKALTGSLKAGKPVAVASFNGLKTMFAPSNNITGVNLAVSQADNLMQEKSLWDKTRGFLLNFVPGKGTYDGIKGLRNKDPKINLGY